LAVICGESPNPMTAEAASEQALRSYARAGISAWPFVAYCVGWTARAAEPYLGPWDRRTAAPVLVVGNTFDPATAYASSVRMSRELARGRLLTVDGFGHTELLNPSRCAQGLIADYLIDGTLPPRGTTCAQDNKPFPGR
jgi:pimeloyl-ACP methyl ester carboxylesterase